MRERGAMAVNELINSWGGALQVLKCLSTVQRLTGREVGPCPPGVYLPLSSIDTAVCCVGFDACPCCQQLPYPLEPPSKYTKTPNNSSVFIFFVSTPSLNNPLFSLMKQRLKSSSCQHCLHGTKHKIHIKEEDLHFSQHLSQLHGACAKPSARYSFASWGSLSHWNVSSSNANDVQIQCKQELLWLVSDWEDAREISKHFLGSCSFFSWSHCEKYSWRVNIAWATFQPVCNILHKAGLDGGEEIYSIRVCL